MKYFISIIATVICFSVMNANAGYPALNTVGWTSTPIITTKINTLGLIQSEGSILFGDAQNGIQWRYYYRNAGNSLEYAKVLLSLLQYAKSNGKSFAVHVVPGSFANNNLAQFDEIQVYF